MLNIITALNSEAQPLIEHFSLLAQADHGSLRVFTNDDIRLIISGIGACKSATAVGYTAGLASMLNSTQNEAGMPRQDVWMNVGIAGHADADIGECFIAHKITNGHTGDSVFPSIPYATKVSSAPLRTVEHPEARYPDKCLYDMEAYGFFSAAVGFSTIELIAVLKVVSDNKENSLEKIDKSFVRRLIDYALPAIEVTTEALASLANSPAIDAEHSKLAWTDMWHTTHSQTLALIEMERRLVLLNKDIDIFSLVKNCPKAEDAMDLLADKLANASLRLDINP